MPRLGRATGEAGGSEAGGRGAAGSGGDSSAGSIASVSSQRYIELLHSLQDQDGLGVDMAITGDVRRITNCAGVKALQTTSHRSVCLALHDELGTLAGIVAALILPSRRGKAVELQSLYVLQDYRGGLACPLLLRELVSRSNCWRVQLQPFMWEVLFLRTLWQTVGTHYDESAALESQTFMDAMDDLLKSRAKVSHGSTRLQRRRLCVSLYNTHCGGAGDGGGAGGGAGGGTGACLVFRIGFVGEVCRQPSLELGTLNESTRTAGDLKLYITAWASNLALLLASVCSVAQEAAALEETTAQVQLLFTVTCCRADAEQAIPAAFDTALNNAKRTLRCWNLSFPKVTIEAAEFVIYPSRAVSMCASYLRHFDRSTEHLKLEVLTRGDLLLTCKQCDLTAFVRRCVTEGYLGVPFKIGGDVQKFVFIEEECCLCDTFWVLPKGVLQPFVQYLKDPGRTCPQRCKCSRGWRPGGHAIPGGNVHYVSRHPDIKGKIATFLEEPVCSPNTAVIANGFYELLGRPVAQGAFE